MLYWELSTEFAVKVRSCEIGVLIKYWEFWDDSVFSTPCCRSIGVHTAQGCDDGCTEVIEEPFEVVLKYQMSRRGRRVTLLLFSSHLKDMLLLWHCLPKPIPNLIFKEKTEILLVFDTLTHLYCRCLPYSPIIIGLFIGDVQFLSVMS